MIKVFLEDAPKNMDCFRNGLAAGDIVVAADRAHALRGGAKIFGARAWSELLQELETAAHHKDAAKVNELARGVELGFAATIQQLKAELQKT